MKTDGKRGLALEELVDVQQLLRRLRERAQRCCERGTSTEVAQLGGECAARPETGGHFQLLEAVSQYFRSFTRSGILTSLPACPAVSLTR